MGSFEDWKAVTTLGEAKKTLQQPPSDNLDRISILDCLAEDDRFGHLPYSAQRSHKILSDWWKYQLKNESFREGAREGIERANELIESLRIPRGAEMYTPAAAPKLVDFATEGYSYHYYMAALDHMEFDEACNSQSIASGRYAVLNHARRNAVMYASCYRVATHQDLRDILDEDDRPPLPLYKWLPDPGPHIEDLPKYLWDKEQEDKSNCQRISAYTEFSGVPWKIYDNDKFDYRRLPDLLEALDLKVRYIWIHLLTIPQLDSNENDGNIESKEQREFEEGKRNEIARQTTIFQNASYVIAWLKDDIDWNDFPKAIKCMTSELLDKAFPDRESLVTTTTRGAETTDTSAAESLPMVSKTKYDQWFTSLWALQEVCLRPDMVLYGRDLTPLLGLSSCPVSINDIATLCAFFDHRNSSEPEDYVKELLDLMKNTGLINLPTLSQLSILAMATHRECSNDQREGINDQRRAQAITSALGVTDWYQTVENWAKGMLLKQYPLPFVNEAKLKIGSSAFFASEPRGVPFRKILADYVGEVEKVRNIDEYESMKSLRMDKEWLKVEKQRWRDKEIESRQKQVRSGVVGEPDKMKKIQTKKKGCGTKRDLDEREEKLKKRKMRIMKKATRSMEEVFQKIREDIGKTKVGVGSMLPFGPGAQDMIANVEPNEHIVEHESPKSWQIDAEGRVYIQEAGIVIKTQELRSGGRTQDGCLKKCTVVAPSILGQEDQGVTEDIDLNSWIHDYKPTLPNYAVCLAYSRREGDGMVDAYQRGILFKEICPECARNPALMLKVGTYSTRWYGEQKSYSIPRKERVNWLVI